MEALWFWLVTLMLGFYVVFDGFDLGAGIIHLWVARKDTERRLVLRSIGPVWDGNEVWLLAAGGTLYFAFPQVYASAFSGFYLPLMIVLWLLVLRGIAIEFRNHLESPVWQPFWDATFALASILLALFFAAALGNVVRGVPLDGEKRFFAPLWTDFRPGRQPGVLDWYTVPVGLVGVLALTLHGGLWVAMKTDGEVSERAQRIVRKSWWTVAIAILLVTALTYVVQPQVMANLRARPWGGLLVLLAFSGLAGVRWFGARGDLAKAFLASSLFLLGMMVSVAFGLYPFLLPATTDPSLGLGAHNAAAPEYGLQVGLTWWIPGMTLVAGYFVYSYRNFSGKVSPEEAGGY